MTAANDIQQLNLGSQFADGGLILFGCVANRLTNFYFGHTLLEQPDHCPVLLRGQRGLSYCADSLQGRQCKCLLDTLDDVGVPLDVAQNTLISGWLRSPTITTV